MTMKETNREDILSRLMDGEWEGLDATRCVAEVCESEHMQDKWARYHMVRDVMRGDVVDSSMSIAAGVSAALADEPAYTNVTALGNSAAGSDESSTDASVQPAALTATASESKARSRWGMGAAGFGIAASAALVTVLGMDFLQNQNSPAPQALVAGVSAPAASVVQTLPTLVSQTNGAQVDLVSNRGSYWVSGQDGQRVGSETRLNQLLGDHIEHSATIDWRGMMPYSRLVGYDANVTPDQ